MVRSREVSMGLPSIVAIVGPTASGKSELALGLATHLNGEIVCADSRTIYKGMDIGTSKPTKEDQKRVVHYCIDLVEPDQHYSVVKFKNDAEKAIELVSQKGKLPILVGGSGLYIDSIVYNYDFPKLKNDNLDHLSIEELQDIAHAKGYDAPTMILKNKRHLVGYIRRDGAPGSKNFNHNVLMIGINPGRETINNRIEQRVDSMLKSGFIDEVKNLLTRYSDNSPGFNSPGYKPFIDYINGKINLNDAKKTFISNDKSLAKRQLTWFKRNKNIKWFEDINSAESFIIKQWS